MLGCIMPMSSPMMKRMLGFCCCCAAAGVLATATTADSASKPSHKFRDRLIVRLLEVCLVGLHGQRTCTVQHAHPRTRVTDATNHLFAPPMVCLLARYSGGCPSSNSLRPREFFHRSRTVHIAHRDIAQRG